jgi:hypothetical protein
MLSKHRNLIVVLLCIVILTGCAAGNPMFTEPSPAGFWAGLWHGMVSWIAFVVSFFDPTVEVYERANNGGWYDFGFLLGAGGSSCSCVEGGRRTRS